MTIMDTLNLVAEVTKVPLTDLTFVGTRRYGPEAPVRFTKNTSPVTGPSDVDVVVPWNGDMAEMRSRIEAAFPGTKDHPNRGRVPYEGVGGWTPFDLNLVVIHEGVTINLIVKNSDECASWRAAADELDKLSLKPVVKDGIEISRERSALWYDKPARVAAFKAARNAYLQGYAKAKREDSAAYWKMRARATAAERDASHRKEELELACHDLVALRAKVDEDAHEAHQRQKALEAQLRVRGILMVTFLVAFAFMVWYAW